MKLKKSNPVKKSPSHSTSSSKNFKIYTTTNFIKEAERLKKKYPNIKDDFYRLQQSLKEDPVTGHVFLGNSCFKVRLLISDKNCGESGGARVIIEVKIINKKVYVLSVYDKSEKSDLFDDELDKLLEKRLSQFND